jgi:ATP-dependent Lon protease
MEKADNFEEVPIEKLRWRCDPEGLGFESTDEVEACTNIIGQKRGVNALRLGLDMKSPGYNIFVTGLVGTGRKTAIRCMLEETDRIKKIPDDKLYVNNFKNPDSPRLIRLPAGQGKEFKKDMGGFVEFIKKNIPTVFESEGYQRRRKEILDKAQERQRELIKKFEEEVTKDGFALTQIQMGPITRPVLLPLIDGKPSQFEQLSALVKGGLLSQERFDQIMKKHSDLTDKMEDIFKEMRDIEKGASEDLRSLDSEVVTPVVQRRIDDIKDKYKNGRVDEYLDEAKESVIENLDRFREKEGQTATIPGLPIPQVDPFLGYNVNLLVDNSAAEKAPVIFETSPTYRNLFGTIEITPDILGRWSSDFTKIKAGSLLRADGGFLIIEALDALIEPGVWPELKRTLRNGKVEIQNYAQLYMIPISALKPEPIECDVKVAMIGDPFIYDLLYSRDVDFKKIFKVRSDFDSVMDLESESINQYAAFAKKIVSEERLMAFDSSAIAAVVEHGVKKAGRQNKLSTQFNDMADILREANFWASRDGSSKVNEKHVERAIEEKIDRSRLIEEKIQEMIDEGMIMIDTKGSVVGQVNGLSVYGMGDYSFGKPSRITARVSLGSTGIVNIEREAELSGRIHDKGVLILAGYLRSRYAQDKPLAVNASLCFEQSYSGVEGDSASSTELYALLSALSEQPICQDIAVTGSVNQKGEIQPIGGVNQKIEGFFDVCKAKGLTGSQGVIIPHQNVGDLMLRKDVVNAIKDGKFHIYPVKTIDQGIEILTGIRSGEKRGERYEEGTINYLVDEKLGEFAERWRKFRGEERGM